MFDLYFNIMMWKMAQKCFYNNKWHRTVPTRETSSVSAFDIANLQISTFGSDERKNVVYCHYSVHWHTQSTFPPFSSLFRSENIDKNKATNIEKLTRFHHRMFNVLGVGVHATCYFYDEEKRHISHTHNAVENVTHFFLSAAAQAIF